ncbi:hypothetical protein ACLOJK_027530 [Asimina triloba]
MVEHRILVLRRSTVVGAPANGLSSSTSALSPIIVVTTLTHRASLPSLLVGLKKLVDIMQCPPRLGTIARHIILCGAMAKWPP